MSKKKSMHRTTVKKRNLYGVRLWWLTCTCGFLNGFYDKHEARQYAAEHKRKVNA